MSTCFKRECIAVVYHVVLFALKVHQFYREPIATYKLEATDHKFRGATFQIFGPRSDTKILQLGIFSDFENLCHCVLYRQVIESWF